MANESFVNVISVNDTTNNTTEVYNIEAQRMSCGNVGTESRPVYFSGGVPVMCSEDVGGGGSNVQIIPDEKISSLRPTEKTNIATFSIDGEKGNLYIPKTTSGYQRQVIFNGQFSANTIGETQGAMLTAPFTNFEFLYIHIADTRNIVGNQVIVVSAEVLKNKLPHALVSCNLYGTLGIILEFDTPDHVILKQVNNLPNYSSGDTEDGYISVICTKIEGVTLGISSSSWGKNTKDTLWVGEISAADSSIKYTFQDEEDNITHNRTVKLLTNYDTIYVYGHILNEDEEHVDIGAVDFLANKLLTDKAILTCGTLANITKTLKFAEDGDGFYVIAENDTDSLTYVITKIDGIKYGVDSEGGGGGDLSNCMMKGVDYVTAGHNMGMQELTDAGGSDKTNYLNPLVNYIDDNRFDIGFGCSVNGGASQSGIDFTCADTWRVVSSFCNAEGMNTTALAPGSHAEGCATSAGLVIPGYYRGDVHDVPSGYQVACYGTCSHTEGAYTTALQNFSHAEGYGSQTGYMYIVENDGSSFLHHAYVQTEAGHAEGYYTCAYGNYSHSEGSYTISGLTVLSYGEYIEALGNIGDSSHAEGYGTTAYGDCCHAEGYRTYAGSYTLPYQSGEPLIQTAGAHAEGYATTAYGNYSHAEGTLCYAEGGNSHAEGYQTYALTVHSHSEGKITTANGDGSHAEGYATSAKGDHSHAEGVGTTTGGYASHAEGNNTYAYGDYCHAEGSYTCAGGGFVAYGQQTVGAHAEGYATTAYGDYSHTSGIGTYATSPYQFVIGKYNEIDTNPLGSYAFIVGNGNSLNRNNAFTVNWNGNANLNNASIQGADYAEFFEWSDENINNEERIGLFVTFDDKDVNKIRIANDQDDYILGIVSGSPAILGNSDGDVWTNKFLKDEYGRKIYEKNNEGNLVPKINSNFDDSKEYVSREKRKEWAPVGMLGILYVNDDGTCIPGKYCKVNNKGIATYQEKYNKNENCYRVIKRINNNIIQVVFK